MLGYKHSQSIWTVFTSAELDEIEREALDNRRKRYASWLVRVDMGLLKAAAEGDARAAKLCYQRFEGLAETHRLTGKNSGPIEVSSLSDEEVERRIKEFEAEIEAKVLAKLQAEISGDERCTQVSR